MIDIQSAMEMLRNFFLIRKGFVRTRIKVLKQELEKAQIEYAKAHKNRGEWWLPRWWKPTYRKPFKKAEHALDLAERDLRNAQYWLRRYEYCSKALDPQSIFNTILELKRLTREIHNVQAAETSSEEEPRFSEEEIELLILVADVVDYRDGISQLKTRLERGVMQFQT